MFTTCGSTEKRAFLLERFPALRDHHIGDSRSCSFEQMVLRGTRGAGVHLVLNSLAGDKLQVMLPVARMLPCACCNCTAVCFACKQHS